MLWQLGEILRVRDSWLLLADWRFFDIIWASVSLTAWETMTWPACFAVLSVNIEILSWHVYHLSKNSLPTIAVTLGLAILVSNPSIFVWLWWVIAPNVEAIEVTSCWTKIPSISSGDFVNMLWEWIHCLVHSHVTAPLVVGSIMNDDPTIVKICSLFTIDHADVWGKRVH